MSSIRIPTSIDDAVRELSGLGELLTATEWRRAAIVATFVEIGTANGRPRNLPESRGFESAAAFARRGIVGLMSDTTVAIYARAWLDRFPRPTPGALVELPDDPWPPTRTGTDGFSSEEGATRTIDRMAARLGVESIARAIRAVPAVALEVRRQDPVGVAHPPRISDRGKSTEELANEAYWAKVRAALHLLLDVKVKIGQGGVTVPGDIAILMELLVPETDWDEALRSEIGNLS